MTPAPHSCPACGNLRVINLGPLPPLPATFGGQAVSRHLAAGSLFHCATCDLRYRHPYASQQSLTQLYEGLPPTVWQTDELKPHWKKAIELIQAADPTPTVLDVGCFTGDFLSHLPNHWERLGIEPNEAARRVAAERGIRMIGATVDEVTVNPRPAGAITLFDVLEHVIEPLAFLIDLKKLLAPKGQLIIVTGNTRSPHWRAFGRHYWYSSLPEHVSFFSPLWFRWAAGQLGMTVIACEGVSSGDRSGAPWWKQAGQLSLHTMTQKLRDAGVSERHLQRLPLIRKAATWRSVPWWTRAKDHLFVALVG